MNQNLFQMFSTFMEQYKANPSGATALEGKGTGQQEPTSSDEEYTLSGNEGKTHNVEGAGKTHVEGAGSGEKTGDAKSDGSGGKTHDIKGADSGGKTGDAKSEGSGGKTHDIEGAGSGEKTGDAKSDGSGGKTHDVKGADSGGKTGDTKTDGSGGKIQKEDAAGSALGKGEGSGEGMSEPYTIEEYFFSKRSHPARKHLHYVIRKACQETDVWGKRTFSSIPAAKKRYIFDRVVNATRPEMKLHEAKCDKEMRRMLVNAKSYHAKSPSSKKKRTSSKKKPSTSKKPRLPIDKGKSSAGKSKDKPQQGTSSAYEMRIKAKQLTSSRLRTLLKEFTGDFKTSSFIPGDSVIVTHEDEEIAEAIFLEKKDELFAELSFKIHGVGVPEDLSLYHVVEKNTATGRKEKNKFDELEEDDFFLWKIEKIKKRRNLRTKEERKQTMRLQ